MTSSLILNIHSSRKVSYKNSSGQQFNNSLRDILTHMALHGHYHRGQINLFLRKNNMEPKAGKAIASGKWIIQQNKKGKRMLGQLTGNLSYIWIDPVYYPPILLELEWHETELSDI